MTLKRLIKPAIVVFPGSNCEQDMAFAIKKAFDLDPVFLWHRHELIPSDISHVILPGGFSFGDYVRAGVLAVHSPIMAAVKKFAELKGPVLGICNGFQILCESGLLPGVLLKNMHGRFRCSVESVKWQRYGSSPSTLLRLPIAHGEGRFFIEPELGEELKQKNHICLTYAEVDEQGNALANGSSAGIAGILGGPAQNIIGIMPHPERAIETNVLGSDGRIILNDFLFG